MIIHKINFPIYGILIVISLLVGMLYIYKNIEKEKRKNLYLYFIIYLPFAFVFGKIYTMISDKVDFLHAGISSLGGVFGTILSAYIFEKIEDHSKEVLKYTILSLPLVYSISKVGCFLVGCCYGIPYEGIGYVIYPSGLNMKLFPVQLVETISFFLLFVILNRKKKDSKIIPVTLISCSILKFLLDFLRYDHVTNIITINQIFCIIIVIGTIILFIWKRGSQNDDRRIKTKTN